MRNTVQINRRIRLKRTLRNRKHLRGSTLKPRLCVVKTNKHIQVQIIDDEKGVTLGATSTFAAEFRGSEFAKKNVNSAKKLGEKIAELAKAQNIKEVVFDRGPSKYHGILAALADAARAGGLQF